MDVTMDKRVPISSAEILSRNGDAHSKSGGEESADVKRGEKAAASSVDAQSTDVEISKSTESEKEPRREGAGVRASETAHKPIKA